MFSVSGVHLMLNTAINNQIPNKLISHYLKWNFAWMYKYTINELKKHLNKQN